MLGAAEHHTEAEGTRLVSEPRAISNREDNMPARTRTAMETPVQYCVEIKMGYFKRTSKNIDVLLHDVLEK